MGGGTRLCLMSAEIQTPAAPGWINTIIPYTKKLGLPAISSLFPCRQFQYKDIITAVNRKT